MGALPEGVGVNQRTLEFVYASLMNFRLCWERERERPIERMRDILTSIILYNTWFHWTAMCVFIK